MYINKKLIIIDSILTTPLTFLDQKNNINGCIGGRLKNGKENMQQAKYTNAKNNKITKIKGIGGNDLFRFQKFD